ncbi:hypothetical protein [Halomonas sp. CSM-2]|uniref:hypothetical protein n=1 Tax=Halomonas sp. CSM-2 TaxID=1975722 RepID=UPI00111BF628|nr:hypothetical protein [Halomonas sp. CSM-2]
MKIIIPVFDEGGLRPALAIQRSFNVLDVNSVVTDFSNSKKSLLNDWPLPSLEGTLGIKDSEKKPSKVKMGRKTLKKISKKIKYYYDFEVATAQHLEISCSYLPRRGGVLVLPHEFFAENIPKLEKVLMPISDRVKHDAHFIDVVARHWLADFVSLSEETFSRRARIATTRLVGAITDAVNFDLKRQSIVRFLERNGFTHGIFTNLPLT